MTAIELVGRRIEPKRIAIPLIKEELVEDQLRLALIVLQARYENQIGDTLTLI